MVATNKKLQKARDLKNDEWYTRYEDVETHFSMDEYSDVFKNKVVYLPCDDPRWSNFAKYFLNNFYKLELKKLIITFYNNENSFVTEKTVDTLSFKSLSGNGDFNNSEMDEFYAEADWVITNPPFSKINDFFNKLNSYDLNLTTILPINSLPYTHVLEGFTSGKYFVYKTCLRDFWLDQENTVVGSANGNWVSTIKFNHQENDFWKEIPQDPELHEFIDDSDILNINKSHHTPSNWKGRVAVPVSYPIRINYNKWRFIGLLGRDGLPPGKINGKNIYKRMCIERIKE